MRIAALLISLGFGVLSACTFAPTKDDSPPDRTPKKSQFYEAECALGTQEGDVEQFHALIHYPFEHSLRYPGMIVGIEKSASDLVRRGALATAKQMPEPRSREDRFRSELLFGDRLSGGNKFMFISHITQSDDQGLGSEQPVYSAYHNYLKAAREQRAVQSEIPATSGGPVDCNRKPAMNIDAFNGSWTAIQALKSRLENELSSGKFTDVIVISMGWNTTQIEAVQNYNSLVHQLVKASIPEDGKSPTMRPYVIGITWPSEWTSPWVDPVYRGASLFNKANDADEAGSGWMAAVIQEGILQVTQNSKHLPVKVSVLGHSFGARATSMAVCKPGMLKAPSNLGFADKPPGKGAISWLIGLQGAYSLNRDLEEGAGFYKVQYDGCSLAKKQLLTASKHDSVAGLSHWVLVTAPFAGQISAWNALRASDDKDKFNFYTADANGNPKLKPESSGSATWNYVDASDMIYFNAYGTGAGAHSDIYREPMGKLIWSFLGTDR